MVQRVLVTGAARGIGLEIARAFLRAGATVAISDINRSALEHVAAEGFSTYHCDMAKRDQIECMVPEAIQSLDGLDVLVNNIGIAPAPNPLENIAPDVWDNVIATNLTSLFDVSRLAIPDLKKSSAAVILNISSIAGRVGFPSMSHYAATKWAIIGITKTLSIELGPWGIRVNAIAPGAVTGDHMDSVYQARSQATRRSVEDLRGDSVAAASIKSLVDPRDIAALAVFLAADACKSISGQIIPIDNDRQKA